MQGAFRCAYTTCDRTFHSPSEVAAHYNTDHNYSADQPRYDNNEMAQWYEDAGENGHPATDDYYDSEIVETYGNAADAASVQVLVSPTPDPVKPGGRGMFNCKICAQSFSFIDETAVHLLKSHCVILNEHWACRHCDRGVRVVPEAAQARRLLHGQEARVTVRLLLPCAEHCGGLGLEGDRGG